VSQDFDDVDGYIASFPLEVQEVLEEMRRRIQQVVPDALEEISYQIPTYKLDNKAFVYFAGWKTHVSLYPIPPLDQPLETEVAAYRSGKDTVRFPLSEPLPADLVARIVTAMRDARGRRDLTCPGASV
jgi:uncharacterized protein YdhG (YjbR/CyaY superfamily)